MQPLQIMPIDPVKLQETEKRSVGNANAVNRERRVTIAARVPPELAEAVAALADAGDRTVSREVFRAIRTHVQMSTVGDDSFTDSSDAESVMGRSSSVGDAGASLSSRPRNPAERDGETSEQHTAGQSSSPPPLAGEERK
jgi:predicted transcriptional regulator